VHMLTELLGSQHFDAGAQMFAGFRAQDPGHGPDHLGASGSRNWFINSDVNEYRHGRNSHGGKGDTRYFNKGNQSCGQTISLLDKSTREQQKRLARKRRLGVRFTRLKELMDVSAGGNKVIALLRSEQAFRRSQIQGHATKPIRLSLFVARVEQTHD
jgi:hypothetical protein